MTSSPPVQAALLGAMLLSSLSPVQAGTTVEQSNAGITITGHISAQSSNLGVLDTTEVNTPEVVTITKSESVVDGAPVQKVTPAKVGVAGSVDLVQDSQAYEKTQTQWSDSYSFHASSLTSLQADVKYLVYTAEVLAPPASHFASSYGISLAVTGQFTATSLVVPGLGNPANVLAGPVLPSMYLSVGVNGPYQAVNTTGVFSPEGTSYTAYGGWYGQGSTSFSLLVAAGEGVSLDALHIGFNLYDYAETDVALGAPVSKVISSVPLPALPAANVPEPETGTLVLAGLLITGMLAQRRRGAMHHTT